MEHEPGLPPEWIERQRALAARVEVPGEACLPRPRRVLALDIQYAAGWAHVGAAWSDEQGEEIYVGRAPEPAPYVPGAFCFREGPPLIAAIAALRGRGLEPDLVLVDGHGLAHPRRAGAACWVGVACQLPTLGCAKQTLLPYEGELAAARGSRVAVRHEGQTVGWVLRTRDETKPVYVSPGHKVGLEEAASLVLALPGSYRVPDPLRRADHAARRDAKGLAGDEPRWHDLGELSCPPLP